MKLLKIRVRTNSKGEMSYPPGFLDINCLDHLYCNDVENVICWLLVAIRDEDISKITDMSDTVEISIDEVEKICSIYDKKVEKITDEVKIRRIEIQSRLGIVLTEEDLKAIDPSDSTLGINYSETFAERIRKIKL